MSAFEFSYCSIPKYLTSQPSLCTANQVSGLEKGEEYGKPDDRNDSFLTQQLKHNANIALMLLANPPSVDG